MSTLGGYILGLASGTSYGSGPAPDPTVTVTGWSGLSAVTDVPDGYLCGVTGESGITRAIVQWIDASSRWDVVDVVCTYDARAVPAWASTAGEWYNSGGVTVRTAEGARLVDTTYGVARRWNATTSAWISVEAYGGTPVVSASPIKGDSAAPSGWTVTDTDGGGTASVTTDGTRITLSAVAGSASVTTARMTATDGSLSAGGNAWAEMLIAIPAQTQTSVSQVGARVMIGDGAYSTEYGGAKLNGATVAPGRFFNAVTYGDITAQAAFSATTSSETLLELRKVGATLAVRVGGATAQWQALSMASGRAGAATAWILSVDAALTSGSASGSLTVRHGIFVRW